MKRADPRIAGARIGALEQHANAFAHLVGGLICKSDGENRRARNALPDEIGNAMGDDPRLPGTRAGQNEDGPIAGEHSFALLGIQTIENIHLSENSCWFRPRGECILPERSEVSKPAPQILYWQEQPSTN